MHYANNHRFSSFQTGGRDDSMPEAEIKQQTRQCIKPLNLPEKVVWYSLVLTYPLYLLGALYILAPAIGWVLVLYMIRQYWLPMQFGGYAHPLRIPVGVWVWIIGMLAMEVALIAGHLDFNLGTPKLIKSSVGWAKGWALLAVFPLIGATLPIRAALIHRACCIVSTQTLFIFPFLLLAYLLHLPGTLYISPLQVVGGPGPTFFEVQLYGLNPESGMGRWRFFTPWAPAAGMLANVYFVFALQEKHTLWRWGAIAGSILMCLASQSRAGLVCLAVVAPLVWMAGQIRNPWMLFTGSGITALAGVTFTSLFEQASNAVDEFKSARAGSSRVRSALARIAIQRWQDEAPIWGHGIVERGTHLVEYMPIGSHHSWYGLLFVKGIVGFAALAIPLALTLIYLIIEVQSRHRGAMGRSAKSALSVTLILCLFSFGENLEILAYLLWPALLVIGIAFNPLNQGNHYEHE